ncbi:hypothetical protein DYD21_09040 [Rhodohalobacter sp. SW132]|nr:hypothetical protein DYD21_09040 [Rhodohalobacter sp. SW132]
MLSIFQSGCDLLSQNSNDFQNLIIQTEKETYSKEENELITANILNESAEAVFITMPGPVTLDKKIDGKWENLGRWYITAAIAPRLVEIAPEEFLSEIAKLNTDDPIIEETGLYRFHFSMYSSKFDMAGGENGSKSILPLKFRISNTFYISD